MAFLDDVYVANPRPDSVLHSNTAYGSTEARHECGTGSQPRGCDIFQRIAVQSDPDAVVQRGSDVSTMQQGIKILGAPLGHHDYVQHHLERVADQHQRFMNMLPSVPNLQSSWLLLVHCAFSQGEQLVAHCVPRQCAGGS